MVCGRREYDYLNELQRRGGSEKSERNYRARVSKFFLVPEAI